MKDVEDVTSVVVAGFLGRKEVAGPRIPTESPEGIPDSAAKFASNKHSRTIRDAKQCFQSRNKPLFSTAAVGAVAIKEVCRQSEALRI